MGRLVTDVAALIRLPSVSSEEDGLDVVVCCATERLELVLATFPELVAERLLPRAVVGIEADVAPLVDAMMRAAGPTLFVMCVGGSVGGARTRELVETFAARRDPLHRLLVLEVDHDRTDTLRASIVRGAGGMRRRMAPRGSALASMRHSGRATAVRGVVAPTDGTSSDPAVPPRTVVVSQDLCDDVGPIPEPLRPRPLLRLLPDPEPDDAPVDPAAITAEIPRAALGAILTPAPAPASRSGTPWVTAAFVLGTIATVLAFTPEPGAATHLTAGLTGIAPSRWRAAAIRCKARSVDRAETICVRSGVTDPR
jgi:hypothetical protein